MSGPGTDLQSGLRRQVITGLDRIRGELAGSLGALQRAGPEWAGTALEDRLLGPLQAPTLSNPLAAAVLRGLRALVGGSAGGAVVSELRGWAPDPDPAAPRGIAYAMRTSGLAFAIHVTPGPRLGLTASGAQADALSAELAAGVTVTVRAGITGALEVQMSPDGTPELAASTDGDFLRVDFARPDSGERIGAPPGPSLRLGALGFGGQLEVVPGPALKRSGWVTTTGGDVRLVSGGLDALIPGLGPLPLAVNLGLDPELGMSMGGSTALKARLPVALSTPGVELDGLDVVLKLDPPPTDAGVSVMIEARTAVRVSLPGAPVGMRFEGLGLTLPFAFGDQALGFNSDLMVGLKPGGAGVDLDLPVIRAGGFVAEREPDEYVGALSASMPPLSASAFGVLRVKPLSFVVLLGATFPPPGIQIGFGFAVTGMGGVVGINRRVDRNALLRAVTDGSAAALLFPTDPAAGAKAAEAALPAIFPPARGSVVAGPMFQLSWGGRLVSASVAVLAEVSAQSRLTILGKLVVGIPDPEAALILIQVTFAGQFDPGEPSVLLVAGMTGSHIVGVPLTGDVCLLTRGGRDATFVLSAGGFHPAFPAPRGIPPLKRITTDLSPLPLLELRCEAYLALTTNTVQFGARVELAAQVAKCGIRGHLSLDVLLQFEPLHFVVDVSIAVALTVFGEDLVGVSLDVRLEGPAKWHARGRGSIDLFLFSVSFNFDEEWGSAPSLPRPPVNVGEELSRALAAPEAWVVQRSATGPTGVVLTAAADRRLGRGELVDPFGSMRVSQRRVPLRLTIDRFDRIPLDKPQSWDVTDGKLGDRPAPSGQELREPFAAGQYLALSDDQELSRPSFEHYRSGLELTAGGVVTDDLRPHTIGFETKVFADELPQPDPPQLHLVLSPSLLSAAVAAFAVNHPLWWPQPEQVVTVEPDAPVTVASAWSMAPVGVDAGGGTAAELHEALGRDGRSNLMVVGAWEMEG
jgi:hypothetical protein